jgi:hypothetical protein
MGKDPLWLRRNYPEAEALTSSLHVYIHLLGHPPVRLTGDQVYDFALCIDAMFYAAAM